MCETKKCSECKTVKTLFEFGKDKKMDKGRKPWCKSCVCDYNKHRHYVFTQSKLEKRYMNDDAVIGFCMCGDYYKKIYFEGTTFTPKKRIECPKCEKAS